MKKLFLVANWKSNKTISDAHSFMISFLNKDFVHWLHTHPKSDDQTKQIVICPPFTLLPELRHILSQAELKLPIELGGQNVSAYEEGAHTGEEAATQLVEFAKYVIIGHSERRQEQHETDEILEKKVQIAKAHHLEPIFCVQGKETVVPESVKIIAYEPLDAIGSGHPAIPEVAEEVALHFKNKYHIPHVLYGGSVTAENVHSFTSQPAIDGVLVGGASLDPLAFSQIIERA